MVVERVLGSVTYLFFIALTALLQEKLFSLRNKNMVVMREIEIKHTKGTCLMGTL